MSDDNLTDKEFADMVQAQCSPAARKIEELELELNAANARIAELEKDKARLDWLEQRMLGAQWGPDSRYTITEFTAADIRQQGIRKTVDSYTKPKP